MSFDINSIFSNILVLNLDRDKDRMKRMYTQASKFNLTLNRVPGIYGKDLPKSTLDEYGKYLNSPGVIGCALSHQRAWQTIIENGWDYGLILEDDVTFTERVATLATSPVYIPEIWSIVYVGHSKNSWPRNACSRIPQPEYDIGGPKGPIKISDNVIQFIDFDEIPMGTWAYAITSSAAQWLLANYKLKEPVDVFVASQQSLNINKVYGIIPSLITHCYEFGSSTSVSLLGSNKELVVTAGLVGAGAGIVLIPISKTWKIILFAILLLVVIFLLKKKLNINKQEHYKKIYGTIPGEFGQDYFDPFENIWKSPFKENAIALLQTLSNIFPVVIAYGTLLGWARHNRSFIDWDDDIDVWIPVSQKEIILRFLDSSNDIGYVLGSPSRYDIKIFWKDQRSRDIIGHNHRWPFVDIYFYDASGTIYPSDDKIYNLPMSHGILDTFPSTFEGINILVPTQYKKILDDLYTSGWASECVSSPYCHRTESSIDEKYRSRVSCKTLGL